MGVGIPEEDRPVSKGEYSEEAAHLLGRVDGQIRDLSLSLAILVLNLPGDQRQGTGDASFFWQQGGPDQGEFRWTIAVGAGKGQVSCRGIQNQVPGSDQDMGADLDISIVITNPEDMG